MNEPLPISNIVLAGRKQVSFQVEFRPTNFPTTMIVFEFRDNFKMLTTALKNLPSWLLSKEECKTVYKELFPYNYYCIERK